MTSQTTSTLQPQRTIAELKELRALTGTADGAQRVAWTETWTKARDWMREKLAQLPVEVEMDEAGNVWATLRGASDKAMLMGGHIDSVPNGGWLDGCLNVVGGLEVLRRIASEGTPPITVRLVDWADEEGARFGRSLFGSSAASNTMNPDDLRNLADKEGTKLVDAIGKFGVSLDHAKEANKQLKNAKAYLELHIEQGPVLESMNLPLGVVLGTFGVERHAIRFTGQSAHAGSTPMDQRRDAFGAAAKLGLQAQRRRLHRRECDNEAWHCDGSSRPVRYHPRPAAH
jgi:hydantoinase/carbamoylase family amidase